MLALHDDERDAYRYIYPRHPLLFTDIDHSHVAFHPLRCHYYLSADYSSFKYYITSAGGPIITCPRADLHICIGPTATLENLIYGRSATVRGTFARLTAGSTARHPAGQGFHDGISEFLRQFAIKRFKECDHVQKTFKEWGENLGKVGE